MRDLASPQPLDKPVLEDDELAALIKACAGREFHDRRDEAWCGCCSTPASGRPRRAACPSPTLTWTARWRSSPARAARSGRCTSTRTARALDRYIRERRRHRWAHLDSLFLTQRGAMSTDGTRERIKVRAEQAGLRDRMHPHRFRHTFAHDFLMNGGQERDLKRLAGWSSDVMLERYGASAADVRAREATKRLRRGDRV